MPPLVTLRVHIVHVAVLLITVSTTDFVSIAEETIYFRDSRALIEVGTLHYALSIVYPVCYFF